MLKAEVRSNAGNPVDCLVQTFSSLPELYLTGKTRRLGTDHLRKCMRILQMLDVAGHPEDMNITSLRFHRLQGEPKRWSVRVTANYRITFGWSGEKAMDVDFEDYH